MQIPKQKIIEFLEQQGEHKKAAQAQQQLPEQLDHEQHADLLQGHGIDPQQLLQKVGL